MARLPDLDPRFRDRPLLIGFSGGLDSCVLLHWLHAQGAVLRAVHVHHGLHPDAERWAEHCREVCAQARIECSVARVQVERDCGRGLEAAARAARYGAFAAQLREAEVLVLAHHRDDQAETVLLRLLRGAGSEGLAAMRAERAFAERVLWRPLLAIPRDDLLAYARQHGLNWIDDPANDDVTLDRNFLRRQVLPRLRERWPHASAALAQSAAWLEEDAQLLGEEARRRLAAVQGLDPDTVSLPGLLALPPAWRRRLIRAWLAARERPPLPGHAFDEIERSLLVAASDAEPEYRWTGQVLRRWRDLLHVETVRPSLPEGWRTPWDGTQKLLLPTGDALEFVGAASAANAIGSVAIAAKAAATGAFHVGARQGGERINLRGRRHSHALKHVLQDLGVPPWQRDRLPLLFADDGELLAAGDLAISQRFSGWLHDHGLSLVWRQRADATD